MGVVGVQILNGIHLVHQALVAQCGQHFTGFSPVDGFHDALLKVDGEAFIEPKVIPCGIGHEVPAPGVRQFVGHEGDQRAVSRDDRRRGKRQPWILHATKRKGCRQDEQVVAVPSVGAVELFCSEQQLLHFAKLVCRSIDEFRHGIHGAPLTYVSVFHLASSQGE